MKRIILLIPGFLLVLSLNVFGHCDSRKGPVVTAARESLRTGNINYVLIWIKKKDEPRIVQAFHQTLKVRKTNPDLREWADEYFFETVVRIHRVGEGESYTGIKEDLQPQKWIVITDSALNKSSVEYIIQFLELSLQEEVKNKFNEALAKKNFNPDNVDAGRLYLEKYVELLHYIENVYSVLQSAKEKVTPGESNDALSVDKNVSLASQREMLPDHETNALSTLAVFVILGGIVLIIAIQIFMSHRKRKTPFSSHRHSHYHIKNHSMINGYKEVNN